LANAPTDQALWEAYQNIQKELTINASVQPKVVYARDTRASGPRLVAALEDGLKAAGAESTDYKLLTTPQLHYITRCINTKGSPYDYGEPTEQGYYNKLADAFKRAMKGRTCDGGLTVDCANGVGGPKLNEFLKVLPSAADGGLDIKVVNDDVLKPDMLNHQVRMFISTIPVN
jgi:phosphoacetylglucosamine mutase